MNMSNMVSGLLQVFSVIISFPLSSILSASIPNKECSLIPTGPSSYLLLTRAHFQGTLGRGPSKDNPIDVQGTLLKEPNRQVL